jgi:hypothetical protein
MGGAHVLRLAQDERQEMARQQEIPDVPDKKAARGPLF